MLNFLFLFFSSQQKKPCCLFFLLDMFNIYFSCFVLFFLCLEKWFSFRIFCLPVVMYLKFFCFSSNKLGKTSPAFSLSAMLLYFSVLFFFSHKRVWHNPFKIWTVFWNSLFVLFLPSLSLSRKNQAKKNYLCFFSPFLFHFSFQHFFYHHFSLIIFPFIFLFIPFLLSPPFSLLSFSTLSLFLYLSVSFFSLPHVSLSVLLHLLFCVSPFLL